MGLFLIFPLMVTWSVMLALTIWVWRSGGRPIRSILLTVALFMIPAVAVFDIFVLQLVDTMEGRRLILFVEASGYVTALCAFSKFVLNSIGSADKSP